MKLRCDWQRSLLVCDLYSSPVCSEDIQIEIQMVQKIKALEQILRIPTRTPSGDQTVLTREPIENHC